jgi:predicted DNA-binding transcriptional regulator AlpA
MTLFFIGIAELAAQLGIARGTLHKHLSGARRSPILQGLPDPVSRRGKTLWISQDVEDWLEGRRTFRRVAANPEPHPPAPRRGRPRKTSAAAAEGGAK